MKTAELHSFPVGLLYHGKFCCRDCAVAQEGEIPLKPIQVYRENVFPYRGTCYYCHKILVEPQSPDWPDLF